MNDNIEESNLPNLLHIRYCDLILLLTREQLENMVALMASSAPPYDFTPLGPMRAIRIDVDLTEVTPEDASKLIQFIKDDPIQ